MESARYAFASVEELADVLRQEPPGGVVGLFHDTAFDIYHRGISGGTMIGVLVLGGALAAAAAATGASEGRVGLFARVWLSSPLGIDLLLQSRAQEDTDENGLARYFDVDATNQALAIRRLSGPMAAALLSLRERYTVDMDEARRSEHSAPRPRSAAPFTVDDNMTSRPRSDRATLVAVHFY